MNGAIDDPASRAAMPKHEALVTDVREVQGGKEAVREVIKYMTKDIDSDGRRISPRLYAPVYEALDGVRVTQATSGFMALAAVDRIGTTCPHCGVIDAHLKIRRMRPDEGSAATRSTAHASCCDEKP